MSSKILEECDNSRRLFKYVPHGIDEKKYFPIVNDFEFEAFKERILGEDKDFVVLHVSRNIRKIKY